MGDASDSSTETLILNAALKVFTTCGFAAARTEDIAREAGINRALLHYYFRDKETIFNLIFESQYKEFFGGIQGILSAETELKEKIRKLIHHEITTLQRHPNLARFIVMEIARRPEMLKELAHKMGLDPVAPLKKFVQQINREAEAGTIRFVDGKQLLMNIMSMCIYPFIARPIVCTLMQLDEPSMHEMLDARKAFVYEFTINALRK